MKKINQFYTLLFFISFVSYAQNSEIWNKVPDSNLSNTKNTAAKLLPKDYDVYNLDFDLLKTKLLKTSSNKNSKGTIIDFPNPNGEIEQFKVHEASIMAAELQKQYQDIKSYVGVSIDNPSHEIRFSTTVFGLHTLFFSDDKTLYIDPYNQDINQYIAYKSSNAVQRDDFICQTKANPDLQEPSRRSSNALNTSNGIFRKYRLALASTVEYSNFHINAANLTNGTLTEKKAAVLAAMVVTMTRVNGIYERELALTLELIANNDKLISIDTDNFTNDDGLKLLTENQSFIESNIGNTNYDIGHVFSTGAGGVAQEGCVCTSRKAQGTTGTNSPTGDKYDVDFVAHEMGHQLGASHTFNGSTGANNVGNCDPDNRVDGTAVEPGSGSTIMGYTGICSSINIQPNSDDYFSFTSLDQINNFINNNGNCSINTNSNNPAPVISNLQNYTIPLSTPFVLNATVTDANNSNSLTYCWEQSNNEASIQPPLATNVLGPLFRSLTPTSNSERYFPSLQSVVANNLSPKWGVIPAVARNMDFVLTVRDNNSLNGGQTASATTKITVAAVGPFLVQSPNTNVSWEIGTNQTVTWDVAGTTANGINTAFVDIFLSDDGGVTFPIKIATKVPNNGSQTITVPDNLSSTCRIMVKGFENVFYDISNENFTIVETTKPDFRIKPVQQNIAICNGANTQFSIDYTTTGGFSDVTNLSATGNPAGTNLVFSKNSINANGTVDIIISNTINVTPAVYNIIVTGVSGSITKIANLYLEVNSSVFPATKLLSPTNKKETPGNEITLSWENAPSVPLYDVEVATDSNFTEIVNNGTVKTNSFLITPDLPNGKEYFWRVLPKNPGCQGSYSEVFQFKTVYCSSFVSQNVPISIPDKKPVSITSIINIPIEKSTTIDNLSLNMELTHPKINDITATLISPSGIKAILFSKICSTENVSATFDNNGTDIVCGTIPAIQGTVKPQQPFDVFYGKSSRGTWKLQIEDSGSTKGGKIQNWNLNICNKNSSNETFVDNNKVSIYPNPNNGTFNVEMNNITSNQVTVLVYDMSGKRLYAQIYNTTEKYFNRLIELKGLSPGFYVVTAIDGEKKSSKKIIIY